MVIQLCVVRFRNEDVIATSGTREVCQQFGAKHFVFTDEWINDDGATEYIYEYYLYTAENGLDFRMGDLQYEPTDGSRYELGKFYYADDQGVWLCNPQRHTK